MHQGLDTDAGRQTMLADIATEVDLTRDITGIDALDPRVLAALAEVPREQFVPQSYRHLAFADGPLPIGHGQTISQPFIVALMTHLLTPRPDAGILEIGTGSGYQAAVLSRLVRRVDTIEIDAHLAAAASERLARLHYDNVNVHAGDGWHGWPAHAPYDGIIVTAATTRVPPPLVEQLKPLARLVIPLGPPGDIQNLMCYEKTADGVLASRSVLAVAFVPLTRQPE